MSADVQSALSAALTAHGREMGGLLPVLHALQDRLGYVPPETIDSIAEALNLSRAEVHGVITFYHDFRTSPPGRCVVRVCRAEACQAVGAEALVQQAEALFGVEMKHTRADGAITLEPVYCLGNCSLGPSVMVDGKLHGRVTAARLAELTGKRS